MGYIVTDRCIACGMCAYSCPDIFVMNNDTGQAEVKLVNIPATLAGAVEEAMNSCPAGAILPIVRKTNEI